MSPSNNSSSDTLQILLDDNDNDNDHAALLLLLLPPPYINYAATSNTEADDVFGGHTAWRGSPGNFLAGKDFAAFLTAGARIVMLGRLFWRIIGRKNGLDNSTAFCLDRT